MNNNLKCKTCKPPQRHPGCHGTCQDYISWKEEYDKIENQNRKQKWLNGLGKPNYKKK